MALDIFQNSDMYALTHNGNAEKSGMIAVDLSSSEKSSGGNGLFTFPVVFTACSVQHGEKVHLLESFNEAIHIFAFGKTSGNINLQGYLLSDSKSNDRHQKFSALIGDKYKKIRAFNAAKSGQKVMISVPGGLVLSGICSGFSYSMSSESNSVINFSLQFVTTSTVMGIAGEK